MMKKDISLKPNDSSKQSKNSDESRKGWDEAFDNMSGDDKLLIPDIFEDEIFEE